MYLMCWYCSIVLCIHYKAIAYLEPSLFAFCKFKIGGWWVNEGGEGDGQKGGWQRKEKCHRPVNILPETNNRDSDVYNCNTNNLSIHEITTYNYIKTFYNGQYIIRGFFRCFNTNCWMCFKE